MVDTTNEDLRWRAQIHSVIKEPWSSASCCSVYRYAQLFSYEKLIHTGYRELNRYFFHVNRSKSAVTKYWFVASESSLAHSCHQDTEEGGSLLIAVTCSHSCAIADKLVSDTHSIIACVGY